MENYINTVSFEGDIPASSLDQKTLSEVKSDSRFEERLEKYCWRQIDGKDHNRLRHVFQNPGFLEQVFKSVPKKLVSPDCGTASYCASSLRNLVSITMKTR